MSKHDYSRTKNLKNTTTNTAVHDKDFEAATGKIPYGMTNDYMFRAVFQSNGKALKGLLCSLLHLAESEISSVEITNPILLGEPIGSKAFHLDIYLLLNDSTRINLEMQITNRLNWQNRSVMYLCRSYDKLNRGQDFLAAKPAVHIGFLDYTLFEDKPEFFAAYKLINVKSHHVYSDNLTLYVADLTRIDLATDEDKKYHIDSWARLFKAETWEELRMTASEDKALYEAARTLFYNSSDEEIRLRCLDREEYYQDLLNYESDIRSYQKAIAEQETAIAQQETTIAEQETTIAKQETTIAEQEMVIAEKEETIDRNRKSYENTIAEQAAEIERLRAKLIQLSK